MSRWPGLPTGNPGGGPAVTGLGLWGTTWASDAQSGGAAPSPTTPPASPGNQAHVPRSSRPINNCAQGRYLLDADRLITLASGAIGRRTVRTARSNSPPRAYVVFVCAGLGRASISVAAMMDPSAHAVMGCPLQGHARARATSGPTFTRRRDHGHGGPGGIRCRYRSARSVGQSSSAAAPRCGRVLG